MGGLSTYLFGLFLGLSPVLSAPPSHAWESDRVNVTIPFDFVVDNKQLKAGDYVVKLLLDGTAALKLGSKAGDVQRIAFTVPITNQAGTHERLLFHHDGDQYFCRKSGSGETRTAVNSPVEFKRRALKRVG
jgi:hypothetical protein